MSFSIQTNVNSLVAQENLRVNSNFQSQTIQRLTSGYRINSSGDDAAGLAVANKFRSDVAELTQGVRNANDGVAQLQIMDGGMSNISKMLDRLKTLATQSASDSFMGKRADLNKEYQTLVNEIDRQAQAIGLSTGGQFAKNLSIFIGGGKSVGGAADTGNGSIAVDLKSSLVDAKGLGLRTSEFKASAETGTNLSSASVTSIANIVTANSGTATFELSGEGYSNLGISVSLSSSDTTATLADKLNAAIQAAGNTGTAASNALRTADLHANAVTDAFGNQQISFTSTGSAFQVTANNKTANALMGNFDASATNAATGASVSQVVTADAATTAAAAFTAKLNVDVDGAKTAVNVTFAAGDDLTVNGNLISKIQTAMNSAGITGVTVGKTSDNTKLTFTGSGNQTIHVDAAGDTTNTLGLGAWKQGTQVTGSAAMSGFTDNAVSVSVTVNGNTVNFAPIDLTANGGNAAGVITSLTTGGNAGNYATLQSYGVSVRSIGGVLSFEGSAGQTISVSAGATDAGNELKLAAPVTNTGALAASTAQNNSAGETATVGFSIDGGDKILVSFTAGANINATATAFQNAINSNQQLKAAGITVASDLSTIGVSDPTRVNFRMAVEQQTGALNLGYGSTTVSSAASFSAVDGASMLASSGASETGLGTTNDVFSFTGLKNSGKTSGNADQQVLNFGAKDADGAAHSVSVTLTSTNAYDVDKAVDAINTAIQASGDSTMMKIVAVKETNAAGTAEGIRFISSNNSFTVGVGTSTNSTDTTPVGLYDGTAGATTKQGMTVDSSASGVIDISTKAGAQQAVVALGDAVTALGAAQAAIGKGQNQLGYAISLAQSQINNFSSAQAQIRDADVAAEAANLTKAQVLQQASIAAMAQANSAPQAVLSLLRG